jgi:heat shock protein HtpX
VSKEGSNVRGINRAKTWILIAALGGLFVGLGAVFGGRNGAAIMLVVAFAFNFAMYWFSDRIAIGASRSKPVTEREAPDLYRIVRELTQARGLPMPKIYISDMPQPNAFATGRNPKHSAVSVTKGLLEIVDERELRGVLAHELSHVANHDILVSSVAAAIGTAITWVAYMALWFGGSSDDEGGNPLVGLLAVILAPIAAGIIQMAVSRSREYQADESGAYLSHDPKALADALQKIDAYARRTPPATLSPSQAHLFIMNPFSGRRTGMSFSNLFSTHPPTEDRVARLQQIEQEIGTNPTQPLID